MITPFNIYFNSKLIWQKHEFWRLFTNFFYFGNLGAWRGAARAGGRVLPGSGLDACLPRGILHCS